MAIYVVDGLPRHGKTAYIINKHIVGWLKDAQKYGIKVFSNVFIHLENIGFINKNYKKPTDALGDIYSEKDRKNPKKLIYYWANIDTWNLMKRGVIICDEATRYFNARRWALLSEETEIKLQQHGKDKLDIWAATQHWSRLDVSLRVLVERYIRVERVAGLGNQTYLARASDHTLESLERWERDPQAFEKKLAGEEEGGEGMYFEYFMPIRWFRKPLYDSDQQVGDTKPMPLKHLARYCNDPKCRFHKKPKIIHV